MEQPGKGKQWHLGMRLHRGVGEQSALVHSLATTAAMHDLTPQSRCSTGKKPVSGVDG